MSADNREGQSGTDQHARVCMPQVVDTYILQTRSRAQLHPGPLDIVTMSIKTARKYELAVSLLSDVTEQLPGGCGKRNSMLGLLFRSRAGLCPDTGLEIELIPSCREHFALSRSG